MHQLLALAMALLAILAAGCAESYVAPNGSAQTRFEPGQAAWRASEIIGLPLRDADAKTVGHVTDLIASDRGTVAALAVMPEGGDAGRAEPFRIPWDTVSAGLGREWLNAPLRTSPSGDPSGSGGRDAAPHGASRSVMALLDTRVDLVDVERFGTVEDFMIAPHGEIQAVLVATPWAALYALPWTGVRIEESGHAILIPVTSGQLGRYDAFPDRRV